MRFVSVILAIVLVGAMPCAPTLWAQPQQSEDFRITKSVIDAGGAASASENFQLVSAFGQPSPLGAQTSESFLLWPGFLTPTVAISPLSPIQALIIQATPPNVTLVWERIASANSYNIYREASAVFTPGPGNFVTAVADTFYVDATGTQHFYIITASTDAPPPLVTAAPPRESASHDTKKPSSQK